MSQNQKMQVRVVVRGAKPKPYYPKGTVGDSSDVIRMGCGVLFFIALIALVVAMNWPVA